MNDFVDIQFRDPIEFEDVVLVPLGFRPSTPAWRVLVKADYGSPLTPEELALYLEMSGGVPPREGGSTRILDIIGRRAGKSETIARCAYFECVCVPHYRYLAPGQIGVFALLAQERDVSCEVFRYLAGYNEFPELARYIKAIRDSHNDRRITFTNGVEARVVTASKKSVRGPTFIGAVADEIAFWPHEGDARDVDVLDALTPGLMRSEGTPPRRLWAISSANIKSGWAWETFDRAYGQPSSVWTVRRATSRFVRPNLDEAEIAADCEGRPGKREREYESEWLLSGEEAFFGGTMIESCVDAKRPLTLPTPIDGLRYYVAIDAAFLHDEFAVAVVASHMAFPAGVEIVSDTKRSRRTDVVYTTGWTAPRGKELSPAECVVRVVEICRHFGTPRVYADQHASVSLRELFRAHGVRMIERPWSHGDAATSKAHRFDAVRMAALQSALTLPPDPAVLASLATVTSSPTSDGGVRIVKSKGDDRACAIVLAASEALGAAPSIATATLTYWERRQREIADRALAFVGMPGGGPWL